MGVDDPHQKSIEEIEELLCTSAAKGMTSANAEAVLKRDGPNELESPPKPTLFILFVLQLTSFVIVLLLAAAVASVAVNAIGPNARDILSYITAKAIFIIVLINAGIAAWTEHQAGDALDALSAMSQPSIFVVRDGSEVKVDVPHIVRGDLVVLGTGDVVPADLRLCDSDDLKVSEMALTGEPEDVAKNTRLKSKNPGAAEKLTPENMVFSGSNVTNGRAKGIVVEVGMSTRMGRIAQLITGDSTQERPKKCGCLPDTTANQTPLQTNLDKLGAKIGIMAIGVCVAIFIIGVVLDRKDPDQGDIPSNQAWLYMILVSVTLAVAAIPEGIPLCVTIALSIGCSQMVEKNVLVRKLAAVETLGSASVICSDKTGTLTEGKMTMVNMWAGGVSYEVTGKGFDPTFGGIKNAHGRDAGKEISVRSALYAAVLCCNTTINKVVDPDNGEIKWEPKGNSSEAPIIVAARKVGFDEGKAASDNQRVMEVPFSSSRKMMLTVTDMSGRQELCPGGMKLDAGAKLVAVCKGAPNFILEYCTEKLERDGSVAQVSDTDKKRILKVVDEYSSKALRVLAIACVCMKELPFDPDDEEITTDTKFEGCRKNLRLLGLVASIDPDRDGVAESVLDARGAGIRVVMITGDYLKTATAIAHNVNILLPDDNETVTAVDCAKLRPDGKYLSNHDMDRITATVRVFARAKPEDKLEIVKSLQRQHLVTAMTGDGVNDAPALNQADIGVAMGIQGTEVAKDASDMILTDDNFTSIVAAVEKGRIIYAGIQKFVAFIMSVHIAEVIQIFICIVLGIPVMRTPLQILFLILVTDLPACIALAMEPGEKTVLKDRPRPKEEPVVLSWMWVSMTINGIVLSLVILGIYIWALLIYCDGTVFQESIQKLDQSSEKLMDARTVAFISLVWAENIRGYCSRSFDRPFYNNIWGNAAMQKALGIATVALYVAVLVPFFSTTILGLDGVGIGVEGWVMAAVGPAACVVLCEGCKLITVHQMESYQASLAASRLNDDLMRHEQNVAFDRMVSISSQASSNKSSFAISTELVSLSASQLLPPRAHVAPQDFHQPARDLFKAPSRVTPARNYVDHDSHGIRASMRKPLKLDTVESETEMSDNGSFVSPQRDP